MHSLASHEIMKDTYDRSKVTGTRLQVWLSFMDRLYELDCLRDKKRKEMSSLPSQDNNEKN